MSVVRVPLPATAAAQTLPDAVQRVVHDDVRVVLTREGEPVAAVVSIEDLRALENLGDAEEAYWEKAADEAVARWQAEGRPKGVSHEALLARHGIAPDDA